MPVFRSRPLALALGAVLVAPLAASCSGDDPRDDAPRLKAAWTSEAAGWDGHEAPWVADDDIWVYRSHETAALVGVDLDDGAVEWSLPMGEVCALSAISESGSLAVQSGRDCASLTLLDVTSGEERWSSTVRFPAETYPTDRGLSVGLGATTVTVATRCGVERWSVSDGSFQGRLAARGTGGPRCQPSATTGDLALVADRSGLIGYDADTGERRWRQPGAGAALHRVHSVDPLLVDIALQGVRGVRALDPATGEPGAIIGRPLPQYGPGMAQADPVDDVVIGAYRDPAGGFDPSYQSVVRAWDTASGEQRWDRLSVGDDHLGGDATGVYLGRSITEREGGDGYAYWVTRWRTGDSEPETVGWIDEQVLDTVRVGDLLITGGGFGLPTTAYRLPAGGEDLPVPKGRDSYSSPEWAPDDLRPDPRVDPCTEVSGATLRTLGISRTADLPAPLDCRWVEGERVLVVQVEAVPPRDGLSAEEAAQRRAVELGTAGRYDAVEGTGLGDEVWYRTTPVVGVVDSGRIPGSTSTDASVLSRRGNVVVQASLIQGSADPILATGRLPIAGARVQTGLRDAVREALSAWPSLEEQGDPDPSAGADGSVTAVPEPCAVLGGAVRRGRPEILTASGEDRLRGCRWQPRPYGDFVQVTAYAVGPDAVTGDAALDEARAIVAPTGRAVYAVRAKGPWDEGWLVGDAGDPLRGVWRLVARAENVVLVVQVVREGPASASRTLATDLARRYLDEVRPRS